MIVLENEKITLKIMEQGATVTSLKYCKKETVASFNSPKEYIDSKTYCGRIIGRYGNRIGNARISIEGKTYHLTANEGKNTLHGGNNAADVRNWNLIEKDDAHITLGILLEDGENGFPGNLNMRVTYTLLLDGIRIDFCGNTDATTVYAPTFHPYFLANNAKLKINANKHIEVDDKLIPTGKLLPCNGDFDYSEYKSIGLLDDAFVINDTHAVSYVTDDFTMDMWTDFPAVQVYSGNPIGVAIEPEFYPDSPNHDNFPSTLLNPGDEFNKFAEYRFR